MEGESSEEEENSCIIPSMPSTSLPSPSPFDAVLAAANMASESLASVSMLLSSSRPPSRHGPPAAAPVRIAPNGAIAGLAKPAEFPREQALPAAAGASVRRKPPIGKDNTDGTGAAPPSFLVSDGAALLMGAGLRSAAAGDQQQLGGTAHHHQHHRHPQQSTTNPNAIPSSSETPSPTTSAASTGRSGADKGLRHFSTRVCAKVEEKGATTYNEVADELVLEIGREVGKCDHKNIRRRVYDALNVLMAIDVIRKDKKDIRWLGIPNEAASEMKQLEESIAAAEKRIQEKRQTMAELIRRLAALKNLIHRNSLALPGDDSSLASASSSASAAASARPSEDLAADRLHLPFILINAPRDCRVHCEMLEDRTQYFFEFDSPFLINEDIELLRLMGLDQTVDAPDIMAAPWLPPEIAHFMMAADSSDEAAAALVGGPLLLPHASAPPPSSATAPAAISSRPFMLPDLGEWDAHHVDALLESMPPAVGGLTGLGIEDFPPVLSMSSPVKGHHHPKHTPTGAALTSRGGAYPATAIRPMRPFRTAANLARRS